MYLRWKGMESTEEGDVLVRTAPIPLSCRCRAHASISEPASERPLARRRSARRARMVGDEARCGWRWRASCSRGYGDELKKLLKRRHY